MVKGYKSKITIGFILAIFFIAPQSFFGQKETNVENLLQFAADKKAEMKIKRMEAIELAILKGLTIRSEDENGKIIDLQFLKNGIPQYYETHNVGAAKTTRADKLWDAPFNVNGNGYTQLGEWDGGAVRGTHQELAGRVTQVDGATNISNHSTHVAGTMIASGVDAGAKGMAYDGTLKAWEWTDDETEMATAAANGLEISNHSYGFIRGWYGNSWYGDKDISTIEDYSFGFYDIGSQDVDQIAYDAPFYLIIKSAGNDRGNSAGFGMKTWFDSSSEEWVRIPRGEEPPPDGGTTGYDCIGTKGVSKNILTIGAVSEVANYSTPGDVIMSSFSGWGPADDGRIKPDVVAKGVDVYSSEGDNDTDYNTYSGTSMSSPNVSGTLALLQQYYQNTHSSDIMRSATLKALVIHTADEAGSNDGPDYEFGWGLVNAVKAAQMINEDVTLNSAIDEQVLNDGSIFTRNITVDGSEPLVVTIVWTDLPGTPVANVLDPTNSMLVNDLDLKITNGGTTYYPWKLGGSANPSAAATNNGPNHVDNVEKIEIAVPVAGTYVVEVSHTGPLVSDQAFSIIVSGDEISSEILADIKVMLEGAYAGTSNMNTTLRSNNHIPITSPHADARTVSSIPANVVDWVFVELRKTSSGATEVSRSAFLTADGTIVDDDGTSKVSLDVTADDYFIVIQHRNHLPIMSATVVTFPNPITYDFTTGSDKYWGTDGAIQLE